MEVRHTLPVVAVHSPAARNPADHILAEAVDHSQAAGRSSAVVARHSLVADYDFVGDLDRSLVEAADRMVVGHTPVDHILVDHSFADRNLAGHSLVEVRADSHLADHIHNLAVEVAARMAFERKHRIDLVAEHCIVRRMDHHTLDSHPCYPQIGQ